MVETQRVIRLGYFPGEQKTNKRLSKFRLNETRRKVWELVAENKRPITFLFGSIRGGDGFAALRLAETIKKCGVTTVAYAYDAVDSAGFIVFLACTKRFAYSTANFKFHPFIYNRIRGSWILSGSRRLPAIQRAIKKHNIRLTGIFRVTYWSEDQIGKIITLEKGNWSLDAERAYKVNVVTRIVKSNKQLPFE